MAQILDFQFQTRSVADSGEFEGYASTFNDIDSYGSSIMPGAFKKSLSEWETKGNYPPVLWQHRLDEPVGVFTEMSEDDTGLKVSGRLLIADDAQAKRAHAHLKARSINGLSIGFIIRESQIDTRSDVERILDAELVEVSLVTRPANENATITSVRSALQNGEVPPPKEFENILRDVGLSRRQAKTFLSRGYASLNQRDADRRAYETILNNVLNWSLK